LVNVKSGPTANPELSVSNVTVLALALAAAISSATPATAAD
jgi:hypothetical protein